MPITIIPDTGINNLYVNPDTGNNLIISGSVGPLFASHNSLINIQGGEEDEKYHISLDQYTNLATGAIVRPSETGIFYTRDNPSGYLSSTDLSIYVTGDVIRPSETGQFYPNSNPSGFITGVDGGDSLVFLTGDQTINGQKTFVENVNIPLTPTGESNAVSKSYVDTTKAPFYPVLWAYPDPVSQSCLAVQIAPFNQDIAFDQPVPYDVDILVQLNGPDGSYPQVTATYELLAGQTFSAAAIAGSIRGQLTDNSDGYTIGTFPGDTFITVDVFPGNWNVYNANEISLTVYYTANNTSYTSVATPANFNGYYLTFCEIFPEGVGQYAINPYAGYRQWVCTSVYPIIWTEITYVPQQEMPYPSIIYSQGTPDDILTLESVYNNQFKFDLKFGDGLVFDDNTNTLTCGDNVARRAGNQTFGGINTFSSNIIGNGTDNVFSLQSGNSRHSLLTQDQLMLGGHKFRQLVHVNSKTVGVNVNTLAEQYQVLGMKASIAAATGHSSAVYTFDNLYCTDVSTAVIPINNEINFYMHGVSMHFIKDPNWVARVNFGVPYSKTVPLAGASAASGTDRQWGVEFYYDSGLDQFMGRIYYYFDTASSGYGTPFVLPIYKDALSAAWGGFIYSMRFRQWVMSANKLSFEFTISDSTSNNGPAAIPKNAATSVYRPPAIATANYRFGGKHINFELASSPTLAPTGVIRMQCANMHCQFK